MAIFKDAGIYKYMSVCFFKVSRKALLHNLSLYKTNSNKKICVMVKGNAYGHGILKICSMLKGKVDFWGVACIEEAKVVRDFDEKTPILIVGYTDLKDLPWCDRNRVSVSIDSFSYLKKILKMQLFNLQVHLKINTGMNRYGIKSLDEFKECLKVIYKTKNINLEGVFTHYSEKFVGRIKFQSEIFDKFIKLVDRNKVLVHADNSFSSIVYGKYDMLRIGYGLYGGLTEFGMKEVKSIYTKILKIQNVKKGESVGYDAGFVASGNMKIAVCGIGYADGFERNLKNFRVGINGRFAKVVGIVCMDAILVDITGFKHVRVGTKVLILGENNGVKISYEDFANYLNTTKCEMMCKLYSYRYLK